MTWLLLAPSFAVMLLLIEFAINDDRERNEADKLRGRWWDV